MLHVVACADFLILRMNAQQVKPQLKRVFHRQVLLEGPGLQI